MSVAPPLDNSSYPSIMPSAAGLSDLLKEYNLLNLKLFEISDAVPDGDNEMSALMRKESDLLDRQVSIMRTMSAQQVTTQDDMKAILKLWYQEVVHGQSESSLSDADRLVARVCEFHDID